MIFWKKVSQYSTKKNTRPNTKNKTQCIDHIMTTHPQYTRDTNTSTSNYSDHYLVSTIRNTKVPPHQPRYTQTRSYHQIDYIQLNQRIANDPRLTAALNSADSDVIAQLIIDVASSHLEDSAPLRLIQTKVKNSHFVTQETKELIQLRDSEWNQYTIDQHPDTLRNFRNLKNRVNKQIKIDKLTANKAAMEDATNARDQWKTAKSQLGWMSHGGPTMLSTKGHTTTSPKEMAALLNEQYVLRAAKTARDIPNNQIDPMLNFNKVIGNKTLNFNFQPVGRIELEIAIRSINPSASSSLDGLSMKYLNKIRYPLTEAILHLVNNVIISTKYPTPLKMTKIIPLFKKGKDPTKPASYRGVNLVPSLAKIIDKIMLNQLMKHLEKNELIPHHHHGGVPHKSTATAMTTLIDSWTNSIESGKDAIALIIDQSMAYDLVDHPILLQKLDKIGLDQHSLNLMKSYLDQCQQAVYLEGQTSPILNTGPRSVVQGSGMSCILLLIFTLDLPLIFEEERISIEKIEQSTNPDSIGYVDDNFIQIKKQPNTSLQESLVTTMIAITNYMASNKLSLNKDKTQLLVLSKSSQVKESVHLPSIPKNITHKPILKLLGIELTDDINWKYFVIDGKSSIKNN